MITFERSTDYELIRAVMTHPAIYPHISDDSSPKAEEYRPLESEGIWYVLAREDGHLLGLWLFHQHNAATWEVHTCLLPSAWGKTAKQAAESLKPWAWEHIGCRRVITNVPECNRLALRFAKQAGFTEFGFNPKSFLKDGHLYGQHMLGISREE